MQPLGDRFDDHLFCAGKAFGVGELLAVVDDVDAKAQLAGEAREVPADVPAPMM